MNDFSYDKNNDILYYTIMDKNNSYGDEDIDNIIFMKDIDTNLLTGITVMHFLKMYRNNDLRISFLNRFFDVKAIVSQLHI